MRIRLKLTTLCDSDLLTLYYIPTFNFKDWVKKTLHTYATTGTILITPLPAKPDSLDLEECRVSLTFNDRYDSEIISFLASLRFKQQSTAVKSILRCSLEKPCLYAFYNDSPKVPAGLGEQPMKKREMVKKRPEMITSDDNQLIAGVHHYSKSQKNVIEISQTTSITFSSESGKV